MRHPGSRGPLSTDWMSGWGRQPDGWDEGPTLASMRRRGLGSWPAQRHDWDQICIFERSFV